MDTSTFGGGFESDEGFAGTLQWVVDNLRIDGQPVKYALFARKNRTLVRLPALGRLGDHANRQIQ